MRIVVVDDQASQRDGRVHWLSQVSGVEAIGVDFEGALALREGWRCVDTVVLDGHDRRSATRRRLAAAAAGLTEPFTPYDRYVGVRVALAVREFSGPDLTRIVLVSAHARDSDLRARRIAQSGIDYVFEHYEVDQDAPTFLRAVLEPETFSVRQAPIDWPSRGYLGEPDVARAIRAVETSPAGPMLLDNESHRDHPEHEWAIRSLRGKLEQLMRPRLTVTAGPRSQRAPRKSWFSEQLREALGLDLPHDPDATDRPDPTGGRGAPGREDGPAHGPRGRPGGGVR